MHRAQHLRARATLCIAVAAAVSSCSSKGGGDSTGPQALVPCTGAVMIDVTAGTTPTFTWQPACGLQSLHVETAAGADRWVLTATDAAGIASGVRYGTVPSRAAESAHAIALVHGAPHKVIAYHFDATIPTGDVASIHSFTP